MYLVLDKDSLIIKKARFAFGGMGPTPALATNVSSVVIGEYFEIDR